MNLGMRNCEIQATYYTMRLIPRWSCIWIFIWCVLVLLSEDFHLKSLKSSCFKNHSQESNPRGHSRTMWTIFYPNLTSSPPLSWQLWTFYMIPTLCHMTKHWLSTNPFPSSFPSSYWMTLYSNQKYYNTSYCVWNAVYENHCCNRQICFIKKKECLAENVNLLIGLWLNPSFFSGLCSSTAA